MTELVSTPTQQSPRAALLRLQLKPEVEAAPRVDGAWWPWSLHLRAELPALLPTLSDRLGEIAMVSFNADVWDDAASDLTIEGNAIRLEGQHSHDANTLTVVGIDGERLTLVVVPPDAAGPAAKVSMTTASQADPGDVEAEAEARALKEVIELLARHEGANDPERTAQIRRWVNDTADQFADAPVKNYVPILVEHIVRDRIRHTPAKN